MFLTRRSAQAEYFDGERSPAAVADFFRALDRINRLFILAEPFKRLVPSLLGDGNCRSLSILDLGAGDGSLGRTLSAWAGRQGWDWKVTNLDLNLTALELNRSGWNVAGSALALPFHSESFDLVIASQMTHHLSDIQTREHLREAWRTARKAVFICDLHRNLALYGLLWLVFFLLRHSANFRADALLSVRRGWRVAELRQLALEAGIPDVNVRLYFGARVLISARKVYLVRPADTRAR